MQLLDEFCKKTKVTYTFALEQMIRLHVPVLLNRPDKLKRVPPGGVPQSSSVVASRDNA